jgi:hypothetical protein
MLSTLYYTNEKTSIIKINKNLTTQINNNSPKGEYSRKQNCFDPSKSSPPNDFMIKLHMRMTNYDSKVDVIKDDNFDSE